MSSILIKNADYLVTMDKKRRVLRNASLFIEGPEIKEIPSKRKKADKVIDASGMIVLPGFINTHLHIPQVFHRHCPAQQNKPIAQWIKITTSINREMDAEAAYFGALVCFAELLFSGATTVLDYFYPFVKDKKGTMEATIKAAEDLGVRFTSVRGNMSQSIRHGTLYDEDVVEPLDKILSHSQEIIEKFHNPNKYSMTRIGLGPCLPFAALEEDFIETARLARKYKGVILQTHAAESEWEVKYCQEKFSLSPIGLMKKTEFLGPDVSLVHCNIITEEEVKLLGKTRTNIVITPICNTRDAADGNGIAPMTKLLAQGANISIGVDGPASNDSMNLLDEMRYLRTVSKGKEGLFWYRNRNQAEFSYLNPMEVIAITNLGGAKTLNRDDIGSLETGKAADIVIFDPEKEVSHAGAINKWAALISCQAIRPDYVIINGRLIISNKQILTLNLNQLLKRFRKIHKKIIKKAQKKLRWSLYEY